MAASLGCGAQGVYQCHMRQMVVKKPLNINDEELSDGMSRIERPFSQPTAMSYSLQRIRLAEISRNIADRTPPILALANGPSIDVVMDIDTELQLLINDIPPFFSMSKADLSETYQLDTLEATKIAHQGYTFHYFVHAQRCKLHFPYFSRGFGDPAFACSKDICLQSARLIIRTQSRLESSGLCIATRFKFLGFLLGFFMASTVLLMDLCHNKFSPQQEERRGEIAAAFQTLEEARQESETAAKFLESLMHVLRKHKVSPPQHTGAQPLQPGISFTQVPKAADKAAVSNASKVQRCSEPTMLSTPLASSNISGSDEAGSINMLVDGSTYGEEIPSYFNDFAQSFEQGVDVGSIDWNNIVSELDSSFI